MYMHLIPPLAANSRLYTIPRRWVFICLDWAIESLATLILWSGMTNPTTQPHFVACVELQNLKERNSYDAQFELRTRHTENEWSSKEIYYSIPWNLVHNDTPPPFPLRATIFLWTLFRHLERLPSVWSTSSATEILLVFYTFKKYFK
jgi:hypothetical protein